jgi:acyl carrier protein
VATETPWVVPASYAQERVWLASQVARDVPLYHVLDRVRIFARIDDAQIREAFATVTRRHETLRTAFRVEDGVLMQEVYPGAAVDVATADVRDLPPESQVGYVEEALTKLVFEPFDLTGPPLWRALAAQFGDAHWAVVFVAHHAIFDAASVFNLHAELTEICAAIEQGRSADLPDLAIQYADFAAWQRDRLAGKELDDLLDFWRDQLVDLPAVHGIPTTHQRAPERSFAGADLVVAIPPEAAAALPEVARQFRTTPFTVLLAAYVALVNRVSGRDDVVVGVPVAGRDRPELLPLIGMFVNMVVMRVAVPASGTFGDLIDRVRTVSLAVLDHQEMPFQKLVESLVTARDPGVPPLYQLGFNHLPTPGFSSTSATAEDDLMLEVCDNEVRLEYNTGLFDESTAQALAADYVRVLAAGLADPLTAVDRLPVSAAAATASVVAPATGPASTSDAEYVAPRTAAEELVAQVWSEVLGIERIGALDDFFDLGGHSLLALRVIARLSGMAGIDVPIHAFFADTTVAGVAAQLEKLLAVELDNLSEDEALRLVGEE